LEAVWVRIRSGLLAELGDKDSARHLESGGLGQSKFLVFPGAACALVVTSAIAAIAGEAISRVIPPIWLRRAAGAAFLALGAFYLFGGE
jgi:Ca2+/H+ antiporter, TMEM165/GDT1 family